MYTFLIILIIFFKYKSISHKLLIEIISFELNICFVSDADGYEFYIVSLDNKQWHFEASNSEERDDWVSAIEQQILNSLQGNESSKGGKRINNPLEAASIQSIRARVTGNVTCVDCDAPSKSYIHSYISTSVSPIYSILQHALYYLQKTLFYISNLNAANLFRMSYYKLLLIFY